MKSALLLISAVLIILLLPASLAGIDSFRTTNRTEPHVVATGGGETTADIVLAEDLFDDYTANVYSITSNVTGDAPVASTYTSSTNTLTVSGLLASTSHYLTVIYKIDALPSYYAAGVATKAWPIFLILGTLGLIAGAVYAAVKHGE